MHKTTSGQALPKLLP